jgi:hypothetical protein
MTVTQARTSSENCVHRTGAERYSDELTSGRRGDNATR